MRKILRICFMLIVILIMTGCVNHTDSTENSASPKTTMETYDRFDYDNRFGMGYDNIIETNDAFYYSVVYSNYLYYYDKASGDRGVLCGNPTCLHDLEDGKDCNGYICKLGASLNYWDGRLHYYANDDTANKAIYSIRLDGTNRQKDTLINDPSIMNGRTPQRFDYHRGMLYGWRLYAAVSEGRPFNCADVISIDPTTGSLTELYKKTSENEISQPSLYYFENYVYISYEEYCYDNEGRIDRIDWTLVRWNIETKRIEDVVSVSPPNDTGLGYRIFIDSEERIWCAPSRGRTNEPSRVYVIENGEMQEAFRFDLTWGCFMLENIAVVYDNSDLALEIRRLDGSIIYEGRLDTSFLAEIDPESRSTINSFLGIYGDEKAIFISLSIGTANGDDEMQCLVRYDLTKGTPVPTVIACAKHK